MKERMFPRNQQGLEFDFGPQSTIEMAYNEQ